MDWIGYPDWLGQKRVKGGKAREYDKAREYARSLGLSSKKEWIEFTKSEKIPLDIPVNPNETYKDKFQGFENWLDCEIQSKFLSYEDAGKLLNEIGINSSVKFLKLSKSGKRPKNIPSNPPGTYKKDWKGWAPFLGKEIKGKTGVKKDFLSFEEAREYVRKLKLKGTNEWRKYCTSGNKPSNIPSLPDVLYNTKWEGMSDWVGTGRKGRMRKDQFLSFDEARSYVRKQGLTSRVEWSEFTKSDKLPKNIPKIPNIIYKEFTGFADWLGCELSYGLKKDFLSFVEAREHVLKQGLTTSKEFLKWRNETKPNIPATPTTTYKDEWEGWANFLGVKNSSGRAISANFLPFEEARDYVRKLGLKDQKAWLEWAQTKRPENIPSSPYSSYKEQWINLADWLGTKRTRSTSFLSFEQSREYARGLNISSISEWETLCRNGKIPQNIPNSPEITFKNEWVNWYDWLGHDDPNWSVSNVKELLRELIKSKIIYQWDEAVLYSFLLRRGVLGTSGKHHEFFKNLIRASRDSEGMKTIEGYVNSDDQNPPDLLPFAGETVEADEEIKTAENEGEVLEENTEKNPFEKKYLESVQDILAHTEVLESISVDDEAMQFYVNYTLNQLWKRAFDNEKETIDDVKNSANSGNRYHDLVVKTFLKDYQKTIDLPLPDGYSFRDPNTNELISPFLMQKYVAYKVKSEPSFGNFSGTGAGKTLSAIIGSRVMDSKLTLIVCPNDVVKHWRDNIKEVFPDSQVISGKDVFDAKYDKDVNQYLVLNYDKLNQGDSVNQILKLTKERIDFVILDEIHFSKITSDKNISIRRENLEGLLSYARKINPEVKVLGLSATPVVNNINEGKSLLELMTGKVYDDLVTRHTIPNAVALYEKLSTVSIRQIPNYPKYRDERVDVDANKPDEEQIKYLNNNPLAIEQILTEARLPQIIKRINGQTIIYTEYVTEIIDKIGKAVDEAGYKFGFYVGGNDTGLEPFKKKEIQVLIASRPISTGVDGLQRICNNLIFNTLPWTNAQYIQLIGRIVRTGQDKEVSIHHVLAGIGGYLYDHLKMNRIKFKKTLADCAVDGVLPERNLITPQKATKEAIAWLARLESGKITSISRRKLDVTLTPVEIETRIRTYGDFAKLNQKINIENSSTTHKRLLADPEEWEEYHRQYRDARKEWSVIPYEVWIKRINELSDRLVIADFGCGEAKIHEAIGSRVHSFDHVSIDQSVTSGDMRNVPLADSSVDIAIFSLSLMGKNWKEYIVEAKRCLATNMYLFIADTTKAMENRLSELRDVLSDEGFDVYQDEVKGDFTFIEARKL